MKKPFNAYASAAAAARAGGAEPPTRLDYDILPNAWRYVLDSATPAAIARVLISLTPHCLRAATREHNIAITFAHHTLIRVNAFYA